MNSSPVATKEVTILSVAIREDLRVADDVLRTLEAQGVRIFAWSVAQTERFGFARLLLEVAEFTSVAQIAIETIPGVYAIETLAPGRHASIQVALIRVVARGEAQDEAAAIVAAHGGRLMALDESGFTAQVTNKPQRIEQMLQCLKATASVEAVRTRLLALAH